MSIRADPDRAKRCIRAEPGARVSVRSLFEPDARVLVRRLFENQHVRGASVLSLGHLLLDYDTPYSTGADFPQV